MKVKGGVCIIDDDHIFIYGVKRLIDETSFCDELMVYRNGQDALDELKQRQKNKEELPGIIFLDLNMPMMTGWEFLDEYLEIEAKAGSRTRVYIISSSVDPQDLLKINEYEQIENYILKPVTAEDLEKIIAAEA